MRGRERRMSEQGRRGGGGGGEPGRKSEKGGVERKGKMLGMRRERRCQGDGVREGEGEGQVDEN